MNPNVVDATILGLAATLLFSGCASIVSGRRADILIDTYPTNAHVTVCDNKGRAVASLQTPGTVTLKRNRRWFLPARYMAIIEAPGYETAQVPIRSTVNPWILGNVVIGGIPGLIVDNATGAAWQPRQSEIHRQLQPLGGSGQGPMFSANEPPPPDSSNSPQYVADRAASAEASSNSQNQVCPASAP